MSMADLPYEGPIIAWRRGWPRLRRWMLDDGHKLVRVRSWRLAWGPHGIEGPTLLVDARGVRQTVTPVWCRRRLLAPFQEVRVSSHPGSTAA